MGLATPCRDAISGVGNANPGVFLRFHFRHLDDGILCFDSATGETSLLPADGPALLSFLSERPGLDDGMAEVLPKLLADMGLPVDC